MEKTNLRIITKQIQGTPTSDGAGVRLNRFIGTRELNMFDPFLLLDEFHSDNPNEYISGFPDHPHRGFETVTYMLTGRIRHKDNAGHEGIIESGGVQWMTAGSGIIHSEIPEQKNGLIWGFQLWINLPSAEKMTKPGYQEFARRQIPHEYRGKGTTIKVITGTTSLGLSGPVQNITTHPVYFDIALAPNTEFIEPLQEQHNAFIYVYTGDINVIDHRLNKQSAESNTLSIIEHGNCIKLTSGRNGAKFLLIAARPLHEPVVRAGPFVMNTTEQINQAVQDYKLGRFL
jgi:quercetin 2,3-dioxygenase